MKPQNNNEMVDLNEIMLIIILNVNYFKTPIKKAEIDKIDK